MPWLGETGRKADRPVKLVLRTCEVPAEETCVPECRVSLRELRVDVHRLASVFLSARKSIPGRECAESVLAQVQITVGQPGVGEGVSRVERHRLLEELDRIEKTGYRPAIAFVQPLQIQRVRSSRLAS